MPRDADVPAMPIAGATADPASLIATRLLAAIAEAAPGALHVARDEARATAIVAALRALAPGSVSVLLFPPWDCLPYDRAPPDAGTMGRRLATLRRLAELDGAPVIVVTTPAALAQRVPAPDAVAAAALRLRVGEALASDELAAWLAQAGYALDARVDEPGEAAMRSEGCDIFAAGADQPLRLRLEDGRLAALQTYDPATQRSIDSLDAAIVDPASEAGLHPDHAARPQAAEHWLPEYQPTPLTTLLDHLPAATFVSLERDVAERCAGFLDRVRDAHEARRALLRQGSDVAANDAEPARAPLPPERLYLVDTDLDAVLGDRARLATAAGVAIPRFATKADPQASLAAFVHQCRDAGLRLVLAAAADRDRAALIRRIKRAEAKLAIEPAADWAECLAAAPGAVRSLAVSLAAGFVDPEAGIAVLAAGDVLGSQVTAGESGTNAAAVLLSTEADIPEPGDAVVHLDHGMAAMRGIERIPGGVDEAERDALRLEFAGGAGLLVPAERIGRVWRYGADSAAVSLERLDGETWPRRRAAIEATIAEAAEHLAKLTAARAALTAPPITPPPREMARFAARFAFTETPDQAAAIGAVLEDLASGRPMDRLVVGDVGYGKTEIALRAAAAVAFAGHQVALAAPTTVLARQHVESFRRRFAGLGIEVGHLSRLATPAEARATKAGLADGSIKVVVGTHALAGKGVRFADLALLVIDEEQRFGAAQKAKLRALGGPATHLLTLTATPIPRTLQTALVGLRDVSVLATPPVRRQPIATTLLPFDPATIRAALLRERGRGGQSFVVCPRVEDIDGMATRLRAAVPELVLLVAHGGQPPAEMDATMLRFADGDGDVLLATNIIESGLDVPRANTMLVWRADRFGLAQLHQLRGRVGRGARRGLCTLLTDPERRLSPATAKRLRTLETLDRLGAGFEIAARDLDQRGGGDLMGDAQAGHLKVIGAGLYRHLLERALATARGEAPEPDWTPELRLNVAAHVPDDYVPEPALRLSLHARLAALRSARDVAAFGEELEDRFGTLPLPVTALLAEAGLRLLCRETGVARVDAGPQAVAVTLRAGVTAPEPLPEIDGTPVVAKADRLILAGPPGSPIERLAVASRLIAALGPRREPA